MKDRIIIIANLRLIEGQRKNLEKTVKELQAHFAKTEAGMLQYDWYVSETTDTVKVLETYENSEAVLLHFDNYKPFAPLLESSRDFMSLEVYGNASLELRQRVQKINAEHFSCLSELNKLSRTTE